MESMKFGLELTLIGMGVVFLTLIALTLLMNLLKYTRAQKDTAPKTSAKPLPVAAGGSAPGVKGTSPEVVAAIAAAVSAYLGQPAGTFTIRSVRAEVPAWAAAGRLQQMFNMESLFKRGTRK